MRGPSVNLLVLSGTTEKSNVILGYYRISADRIAPLIHCARRTFFLNIRSVPSTCLAIQSTNPLDQFSPLTGAFFSKNPNLRSMRHAQACGQVARGQLALVQWVAHAKCLTKWSNAEGASGPFASLC
uniref:Uncharacterized protein n=1 Tax=Setaria viridis TaxID=4556 RepID=A0A4U6W680_SETVI|nr:hypothetical protein SEVIR_1G026100v2 [Setaria viridis]